MKRPTWASVIGILGIIFAVLGLIGGMNTMMSPMVMDMQKGMFADIRQMAKEPPRDRMGRPQQPPPPQADRLLDRFEKMFEVPPWYKSWCMVAGLVMMLICGVYLFASISLLTMKPFAVKLFYWVSGASIAFNLAEALVAMGVMSWMMAGVWMYAAIGIVVDAVLVAVVASSDKLAFEPAMDVQDFEEVPM